MPNWKESMQQSFEYFIVDPGTWRDSSKINNVKSCTISRDLETDTLGSATIDVVDLIGECYVRVYLVTIQNGVRERFPLGTFMVQSPSSSYDGRKRDVSMDAYTPLIELKEKMPPIGYSIQKNENIMYFAYTLTNDNVRAPVIEAISDKKLQFDFVADPNEHWLSFLSALTSNAKYSYSLDELGRVFFSPKQEIDSLQPVWTYDDRDDSILYPEITTNQDLYGIPNVVEVSYSNGYVNYFSRVVNDDPNSPTSTVNRGREIIHRVTNPDLVGIPLDFQVDEYAEEMLKELSTLQCTISYSHGYCPVRLGDCVRINYSRAGLMDIKAKVISQSIKCQPGCQVSEKAIFTTKLWG